MLFGANRIRKIIGVILMLAMLVVATALFFPQHYEKVITTSGWKIQGLSISSENGYIHIGWDEIYASNLDGIQIEIKNDQGEQVLLKECHPGTTEYKFSQGVHGTAYNISVGFVLTDGEVCKSPVSRTVFLDFSSIKGVPLFNINTVDGANPTYDVAKAPNGCWGVGTKNNEYCGAEMMIYNDGLADYYSTIEIKVRGNTSATADKKSYRIKTKSPANLLDLKDTQYPDKEWVLLAAPDFRFLVGNEIAKICGMKWQPEYQFVNLMLNGRYMGCYWLTEAVDDAVRNYDIEETGYIIECDAYWWNSNEEYFKIDNQIYQMGYTFKYPRFSEMDAEKIASIQNHLNTSVTYLKANDSRYTDYIDIESWASWLLTHDILGTADAGGSNMFYYKQNLNENDILSSKIKMGPVWDFDTSFWYKDGWSRIRLSEHGYFPLLLKRPEFAEVYKQSWQEVSGNLAQEVDDRICSFVGQNLEAINHSFYLDGVRWKKSATTLEGQRTFFRDMIDQRIKWLQSSLNY